jgi:anaerobic magnesium-protoporphyrin IX monomethyl ester cyclase
LSVSPRVLLVKFDKPPGGALHLSYSEPIGLCYLAAYLRQQRIACRIAHLFSASGYSALREIIMEYGSEVIGFSVRNFNYPMTVEYMKKVQQEFPGIRIAMGGECITLQNAADLGRESGVDVVFINDGEHSFFEYVSGAELSSIPGIAYKNPEGSYTVSNTPTRCIDIASLPMMARDDLVMENYASEGFEGLRYATMHVQRGCRFWCTFCHTARRYKKPASRTVDQILAEIDYLVEQHGIEAIAIFDEDFFADIERVRGIIRGLNERGNPIKWHSFMKITDLNNQEIVDLLPALRKSGYIRALIGLESFNSETLKSYHKYAGNHVEELCFKLTVNDIILCPLYIVGAPHETCEDVEYGLNRLLDLRDKHKILMDLPYITFITPFPGTELCEEYEKKGLLIDTDWSHHDVEHVVVKSQCPPEKLIELREKFYASFQEA